MRPSKGYCSLEGRACSSKPLPLTHVSLTAAAQKDGNLKAAPHKCRSCGQNSLKIERKVAYCGEEGPSVAKQWNAGLIEKMERSRKEITGSQSGKLFCPLTLKKKTSELQFPSFGGIFLDLKLSLEIRTNKLPIIPLI